MNNFYGFMIIGLIAGFSVYHIMLEACVDEFLIKPINDCKELKQWVLDDKTSWQYAKAKYDLQCNIQKVGDVA